MVAESFLFLLIQYRIGIGKLTTNWRNGANGKTFSVRCEAASTMRRAQHDGQRQRNSQLKATTFSWLQSSENRGQGYRNEGKRRILQ